MRDARKDTIERYQRAVELVERQSCANPAPKAVPCGPVRFEVGGSYARKPGVRGVSEEAHTGFEPVLPP